MKIRNIREYIENRTHENEDLSKIGTNDEPFLRRVCGDEPNVDTIIESSSSFAERAEEQLFYEFVQNAYDANAQDVFFFANEKYLIILNNGKPFYTDTEKENNGNYREGQLFNFLAWNKSQKHGDASLMGNYGQGSKLMYTLLCDVDDMRKNEEQLSNKIKNEKRGPYLLSWAKKSQLDNLLWGLKEWEYEDPNDEFVGPIICKILMSYYPLMPGIDESLFSKTELSDVIESFIDLINPKRSENRLHQGTAIIVPLGKGQHDRILQERNLNNVRLGLKGFTSLLSCSKETSNTKNITLFNDSITSYKSIHLTVDVPISPAGYQTFCFAFSPKFAEEMFISLYNWLPITTTSYGFGFLLNSRAFDIDNSRQRVTHPDKLEKQLTYAFKGVVGKLNDIKMNDRNSYSHIYNSICATSIPETAPVCIRKPFDAVFLEYLLQNVRAEDGEYYKLESVYKPSELQFAFIEFSSLGITTKHWVDPDLIKCYEKLNVNVNIFSPEEAVVLADESKLESFVKSMTSEQYRQWHKYFISRMQSNTTIRDKKVFRTNKGNVISWSSIYDGRTDLFFYDNVVLNEKPVFTLVDNIEIVDGEMPKVSPSNASVLLEKIKSNIDYFRQCNARKECAARILTILVENGCVVKSKAQCIPLLSNVNGEYKPFNQLFRKRPGDTIILDKFVVNGYVPNEIPSDWFICDSYHTWIFIINNFAIIKEDEDWGTRFTDLYLRNLEELYHDAVEDNTNKEIPTLDLSLNENGKPIDTQTQFLNGFKKLRNESQYADIVSTFPDVNFTPYRYHQLLNADTFRGHNRIRNIKDLIEDDKIYSSEIVKLFFQIEQNLLDNYWVEASPQGFKFHYSRNPKNYILESSISFREDIIEHLTDNYHLIPESLLTIGVDFSGFKAERKISEMLSECEDCRCFLDIVRKQSIDVRCLYMNRLPDIDISERLDRDSLDWQIIEYVLSNNKEKDESNKTFVEILRDKILVDGRRLPNSISPKYVEVKGHRYEVYKLLSKVEENIQIVEKLEEYLPDYNQFISFFLEADIQWEPEKVYEMINPQGMYLNIRQLEFCLDCCLNLKDFGYKEHELNDNEDLRTALDVVSKRKFKNFDEFWKIPNFDKTRQIYAQKTLLLDDEQLPEVIYNWLRDNERNSKLIVNLVDMANPLVKLRNKLNGDKTFLFETKYERSSIVLSNTVKWIINQNYDVEYDSNRFTAIMRLINSLPSDCNLIPVLRFTGKSEMYNDAQNAKAYRPHLKVELLEADGSFLNVNNTVIIGEYLKDDRLSDFIANNKLYWPISADVCNRLNIHRPIWTISQHVSKNGREHEWDDPVYIKWRDKQTITVQLSDSVVYSRMIITTDSKEIYKCDLELKDYGYKKLSNLVLCASNSGRKEIMTLLKKVANEQDWFKSPFIELQAMYLDGLEDTVDNPEGDKVDPISIDLSNSKLSISDAHKLVDNIKDSETAEIISNMVDTFQKEELLQIVNNAETVKYAINNPIERDSRVNPIIGYLGELIYKEYLKKQFGSNYEYSADKGEGQYDFIVHTEKDESERLYIDVKTNIKSIEDGECAFYLHRSQNKFIHNNPNAQFRIVRISLNDLALSQRYQELVKKFGIESDPRTDSTLRHECEKTVSQYWSDSTVEKFEATLQQYVLAVPKQE